MDAVEIMRTYSRMCDVEITEACIYCGLSYSANGTGEPCKEFIGNNPEEAVEIVEKWAKEHPVKTRQSEFLKMFPNAMIRDSYIDIKPCEVDTEVECPDRNTVSCGECKQRYWHEEAGEDEF